MTEIPPGFKLRPTSDSVDRLTSASYPGTTAESFSYDGVGNRTASHLSATYGYQPFNRLVSTASATYSFDANGNLIAKTDSSGTSQYSWDFENRLKQVTLPNGKIVTYKYDALGRRMERSATIAPPLPLTTTTRFIYDGQDVIRDTDGNGVTTMNYLNGPGIDNKLRQTTAAASLYFTQDHLGSTRALTDPTGNIVEQQQYDSFGNSTGSALTRYGYTGRERDPDTGLLYYRARWYDPQVGRFISEDPIGFIGGENFYQYVGNSPLHFTDPLGLARCSQNPGVDRFGISDCGNFVMELIRQVRASQGEWSNGVDLALWARDTLAPRAKAGKLGFYGFKEELIAGGQNGFAMVHVAGVAGATLVGETKAFLFFGKTGNQIVADQVEHDVDEARKGMALKEKGATTINYAGDPKYPLDKYIAEKTAETKDNAVGVKVAQILREVNRGKISRESARQQIFRLLCDK